MPILFLLDWCLFYILQFWHRSRFPIFCFSLAMSIFHFVIILHFPLLCFFPVTYLRTSSSSIVVPWSRWSRIDESGQTQPACTGDIACATVDMHAHRSVWTVGQSPALSVCASCLCKPIGCILLWKRQALVCQACLFKHWQSHASMPRLANTITFFPWKTPQQKLLVFLQQIHPPLQIGSTDWRNRINANLSITLALNNNHINNGAHWQEEERQEKGEQSRACCKGQGQSKRGSKGVVGFSIKGDIGTNKEERCTNNEGYKCWRSTWKDACRKEINGVWETFCQTGETNQEEEPSVADSLVNHLSSWKSFESFATIKALDVTMAMTSAVGSKTTTLELEGLVDDEPPEQSTTKSVGLEELTSVKATGWSINGNILGGSTNRSWERNSNSAGTSGGPNTNKVHQSWKEGIDSIREVWIWIDLNPSSFSPHQEGDWYLWWPWQCHKNKEQSSEQHDKQCSDESKVDITSDCVCFEKGISSSKSFQKQVWLIAKSLTLWNTLFPTAQQIFGRGFEKWCQQRQSVIWTIQNGQCCLCYILWFTTGSWLWWWTKKRFTIKETEIVFAAFSSNFHRSIEIQKDGIQKEIFDTQESNQGRVENCDQKEGQGFESQLRRQSQDCWVGESSSLCGCLTNQMGHNLVLPWPHTRWSKTNGKKKQAVVQHLSQTIVQGSFQAKDWTSRDCF